MFQSGHCNFVLYLAISSIAKTVIYLARINELLAYTLDANCCNESNEMKLDGMMASMGWVSLQKELKDAEYPLAAMLKVSHAIG